MWTDHPDFLNIVREIWTSSVQVQGSPGKKFSKKLSLLRNRLKEWNWSTFGNVTDNINSLQIKVDELETRIQEEWSDELFEQCQTVKQELTQNIQWEHDMLRHKAKVKWMKDGDRNTKFFHAAIKERRRKKTITLKLDNGEFTSDGTLIGGAAIEYFQTLFSASPYHMDLELFQHISHTVKDEWNIMISTIPEVDEIFEAVKGLSADSSPGQDGFTRHFYLKSWDVIREDLRELVQGFFQGDYIHKGMTTTLLILIPKVQDPSNLTHFHPISLSNFTSKIIKKIIATRIAKILPQIISEEQTGFVQGRNIHESIALAQEIVSELDRKVTGSNIIFKFDMSKAYDRLEWRFLIKALQALGFSDVVID